MPARTVVDKRGNDAQSLLITCAQAALPRGRTYDALQMRCNVRAHCSCSPQAMPHLLQQALQGWQLGSPQVAAKYKHS